MYGIDSVSMVYDLLSDFRTSLRQISARSNPWNLWYIRKIDSGTATQSRQGGRAERRGAGAAGPPRRKPERDEGTRCPPRTVPGLPAHTPAPWQPAWQNPGGKNASGCRGCRRKPHRQNRRAAGLTAGLPAGAPAAASGGGGGGAPPWGRGGRCEPQTEPDSHKRRPGLPRQQETRTETRTASNTPGEGAMHRTSER